MNEEIEYAEMLEIPVSTVNLVHKKHAKKKKQPRVDAEFSQMKQSVISRVNAQLSDEEKDNEQPIASVDGVPERIDTVRVYNENDKSPFEKEFADVPRDGLFVEDVYKNDGDRYALNMFSRKERRINALLHAEFAVSCALCATIFLTNVFMPTSAINTFFRSLTDGVNTSKIDRRAYSDFTLSPMISENADAELTLSEDGVLTIFGACCVYPSADGKVTQTTRETDGTYTLCIEYCPSFTGVMKGLTEVYYQDGDTVKARVPVGYANGEDAVEVTMYSSGEPLTCFELSDENCLVWLEV